MKKRMLTSILLSSVLAVSLMGCGSSSSGTGAGQTTAAPGTQAAQTTAAPSGGDSAPEAPGAIDTVTMLVNYKATETPAADNPIILAIKEHTGTNLDVMWVPQDAFEEKINTLMACSGIWLLTSTSLRIFPSLIKT